MLPFPVTDNEVNVPVNSSRRQRPGKINRKAVACEGQFVGILPSKIRIKRGQMSNEKFIELKIRCLLWQLKCSIFCEFAKMKYVGTDRHCVCVYCLDT